MPMASMVPSLLQGQVDAILGSIDAYQIQAESQGAQLDNYRFADYGVPTVSTSIFANSSYIKDNPDVIRRFIAASLKGWSFALDNPDKTIKDLKAVFPEMNERSRRPSWRRSRRSSAAAARNTSARRRTRCG